MKVRVLGCSGGIKQNQATTSILVDDDILLDAGTGVGFLSLDEMSRIKHIFISHSHLDHIVSIALLADTLFDDLIAQPLVVHGLPETIKALRDHIFNGTIWPNFTELPNKHNAVLKLEAMVAGSVYTLCGRDIEMIGVNHAVPGVGYCIESEGKVFAFSGDTTSNENFWACLNKHSSVDLLFVETAFLDKDLALAKIACHYCPQLLARDLSKLRHKTKVCISHLKPGFEQQIMTQCKAVLPGWQLHQLKSGDVFDL
jgi:ribonuclease BN (tRNA processing enzyme)